MEKNTPEPVRISSVEWNNAVYADQVAQIGLGPFVTKLVFGVGETAGEMPRPVHTLVMPTPALFQMCQQLLNLMAQTDANVKLTSDLKSFSAALEDLANPGAAALA
jgi:hypothetical protein